MIGHERMTLPPLDFAMSDATRSGRISRAQLEQVSPLFLSRYDRWAANPAVSESKGDLVGDGS